MQKFQPLFYNPEARRSAERRRRFAEHIKARLTVLNSREAWQDYKFTELEAEVEAEGRRVGLTTLLHFSANRNSLRRERSLSAALRSSQERLILVEGEPGAGKSVALRHVASVLVERAMKSRSKRSLIPLYINLKELKRVGDAPVTRNMIEDFVVKSLQANDRDVEEYLADEFKLGLQNGTWLFLFDSFDELPEVLSSTEADETIRVYSEAIHAFLHGMNQCRGIVASRYFRGPGGLAWPRFRIQPLSRQRRVKLVRKVNLDRETEQRFLTWLDSAGQEFYLMLSNPMFLGLLCNHVKTDHPLPATPHAVFETYIESRFARDANRLVERFGFDSDKLRLISEQVAFCMAAEDGLGLNPTRNRLRRSLQRHEFPVGKGFEVALDALEFMKLARSEAVKEPGESQIFTFAHRRFQEYFATRLLLKEPLRVNSRELLTNARWRESAVVLFQTQPATTLSTQLDEARALLEEGSEELSESELDPQCNGIRWPRAVLHVCGILQDGFAGHLEDLPADIRQRISTLIQFAFRAGKLLDRKWALEVAGAAPSDELTGLIRASFDGNSQLLKDVAYWQIGRLSTISEEIEASIHHTLVQMAAIGKLREQYEAVRAYLSRLSRPRSYLRTLRLLEWTPRIHFMLNATALVIIILVFRLLHNGAMFMICVLSAAISLNVAALWIDWRFVRMIRFQVAFYIFLVGYKTLTRTWLAELALIYALLWGPAAIKGCNDGSWTKKRMWPLLPMRPLLMTLRNFGNYFQRSISEWKEWLASLGAVLGLIAVMWLGIWLSEKFYVAKIVLVSALVIGGLLFVYFISKDPFASAVAYTRDMNRFRRIMRSKGPFDGVFLGMAVTELATNRFKARFVRTLRQRGLLVQNDAVLSDLKRLSAFEEIQAASTSDLDRATYVDELCLLIEQLQKQIPQPVR